MSHTQAHIILDRCRAGHPVTIDQINQALELTGDLSHVDLSLAEEAA